MSLCIPLHWAFWCCSSWKLLLCWLWRRIVTTTTAWTVLTSNIIHNVMWCEAEMLVFLALELQMGHAIQGRLEDYRMKSDHLCCPFYRQTMARYRFYHILQFLHFTDNDRTVDSHDRLWKIRLIWNSQDKLCKILQSFQTFVSRSHSEIQGKGHFQTIHSLKNANIWHQNYKLCDSSGYTYDMDVYEGRLKSIWPWIFPCTVVMLGWRHCAQRKETA